MKTLAESLLIAAFCLAGCAGTAGPAGGPVQSAAPGPATPAPDVSSGAETARMQLELPISERTELVPDGAYPVFISRSELLVGTPPRHVLDLPPVAGRARSGVGAPHKNAELGGHILPLAKALATRVCDANGRVGSTAVVHVDATMQYRVLVEVLFTLSELGYGELFIAARASSRVNDSQPLRGVRLRVRRSADVRVIVTESGLWLTDGDGAELGPDCRPWTPQPTPESRSTGLSMADVQRCIESLTAEDGSVHLVVNGGMPAQAVLPLLNSFGANRAVTPVFPNPSPRTGPDTSQTPSPAQAVPAAGRDASQVIGGLRDAFLKCYERELRERQPHGMGEETSAGTVMLTLRVDETGAVSDVSDTVTGNLQSTVECVRSVAANAHFAPPEGGAAIIRVPITFTPSQLFSKKLPCRRAHDP